MYSHVTGLLSFSCYIITAWVNHNWTTGSRGQIEKENFNDTATILAGANIKCQDFFSTGTINI